MTPPGSTLSRCVPSHGPPCRWKYHHGMPFCAGSTTVSGPKSGGSSGAMAVSPCAFTASTTTSAVADLRRVVSGEDVGGEVAVGAAHHDAALPHRRQVRPPRNERDVLTREAQLGAQIRANSPRAVDCELHSCLPCPRANSVVPAEAEPAPAKAGEPRRSPTTLPSYRRKPVSKGGEARPRILWERALCTFAPTPSFLRRQSLPLRRQGNPAVPAQPYRLTGESRYPGAGRRSPVSCGSGPFAFAPTPSFLRRQSLPLRRQGNPAVPAQPYRLTGESRYPGAGRRGPVSCGSGPFTCRRACLLP